MLKLTSEDKHLLEKKQYRIGGNHAAVQICEWNKKAITHRGVCYKEKFYGIDCHKCAQITPLALWCSNNCIFCWRPMEHMQMDKMDKFDEPEEFLDELVKNRRDLLMGFGGTDSCDKKKLKEAVKPNHFAISLSGEPTMYPKLGELVELIKKKYNPRSIFIVSNGTYPEKIKELIEKNQLPTQFYISMNAPNEELYNKINKSTIKDSWKKYHESLKLLSQMNTRRCIRMTLIKNFNTDEKYMEDYVKMIKIAEPDFIEVKAYIHIGMSRTRLPLDAMPFHEEVSEYAKKLAKLVDFDILGEQKGSHIVLLKNKNNRVKQLIE